MPLAGTRWVQSTFSSHSPLSSYKSRWWTLATLIMFSSDFFGMLGIKPRALGQEANTLTIVLCSSHINEILANVRDMSIHSIEWRPVSLQQTAPKELIEFANVETFLLNFYLTWLWGINPHWTNDQTRQAAGNSTTNYTTKYLLTLLLWFKP